MLRFVATTVLTCVGLFCSVCDACNCTSCDCGCPCGEPAATAPASTSAQAADGRTYRTYSYQPTYQPAPIYNRAYGRPSSGLPTSGFHDAGWKARGGF